ncbi:MAG: hypothetical protein L0Y74_10200, partial [candidate division Zixibacteria bacterium]|nr:hypothetical protein [candidate division Zixibacteria bacterium]
MLKTCLKFIHPFVYALQTFSLPRNLLKYSVFCLVFICCICSVGFIGVYLYIIRDLPPLHQLTETPLPQTTHIRDRNGQTLYKIYAAQNRTILQLPDLPSHVKNAFLAIE